MINNNNNHYNDYLTFIKNEHDEYIFTFCFDSFDISEFHEILNNCRYPTTNGLKRYIIIFDNNHINIWAIEFDLPDLGNDEYLKVIFDDLMDACKLRVYGEDQDTDGQEDQDTDGQEDQETDGQEDQETDGQEDQETDGQEDQETDTNIFHMAILTGY